MCDRNLRDLDAPLWLWDDVNEIIRDETRRNIRVSDIDGAVHLYEGDRILVLEGTANTDKPMTGQNEMLRSFASRLGQSVITFEGQYPYPPTWVLVAVKRWLRDEINGWITRTNYTIHEGHHSGAGMA